MIVTPAYRPYSGVSRTGQGNLSSPAPIPDGGSSTKRSIYEDYLDEKLPLDDTWGNPTGQISASQPVTPCKRPRAFPTPNDDTERKIHSKVFELDKELAQQTETHRANESDYSKACTADDAAQAAAKTAAAEKGRTLRRQTVSLQALRPLQDQKAKMTDLITRRKELKEEMGKIESEILGEGV